jgi:aminopeptidase N
VLPKIFMPLLLISSFCLAQYGPKPWVKSERERHSNLIQLQKVQYPGDFEIDITYYGLDLTISTNPNYLTGIVTIGVMADTTEINTCFLDLRDFLTVDSILINGASTTFTHSNDIININLDHTYLQGEPFTLKIYYQGVPSGTTFGGFYFSTHSGTPIISSLSESYSGPYWWPQKDTPADKADSSDVRVTVADNLTPVSNGTLESITPNGNGTHTYHWKNHHPIANYLISIAITNYTQYDTYYHYSSTDSMVITNFIYPEDFNYAKPYVDETDEMIEAFASRYGAYPFLDEKYGHAEFQWGGAMEHQTCTSIGSWGSDVISHELAHQWYGDMITCKDWHHIWLNEGFATYSEAIYLEARDGKAAYDAEMSMIAIRAKMAEGTVWVQNIYDEWEIFDWFRSYSKGAYFLHMLRGIVGDSTFFDLMKAYSNDPDLKYGVATTEDFQGVAESVSGLNLEYFFHEWIYGENEPTYTVGWNKTHIGGNIYNVNFHIYQTANTNPPYFTMPVQVKFNTSQGDTIITLFNNSQNQYFQFQIIGDPQSMVFDPGNWILKNNTIVSVAEDLNLPLQFNLEQNYPNPFNPSTTIGYELSKSSNVILKVYNISGEEIKTLVDEMKSPGRQSVIWDATDDHEKIVSSGIYFYRLQSNNVVLTRKMMFLK